MTKRLNFIAPTTRKQREMNDTEKEQIEHKNEFMESKNMTADRRVRRQRAKSREAQRGLCAPENSLKTEIPKKKKKTEIQMMMYLFKNFQKITKFFH